MEERVSVSSRSHFLSLSTPEEWAVLRLQTWWRRHRRKRFLLMVTSVLSGNPLTKARDARMRVLLAGKFISYREIDLGVERYSLEPWQRLNLPQLVVAGLCIGGTEQVQMLEDARLLEAVLLREYATRCLMCGAARYRGETCLFCWRPYLFFVEREGQGLPPTLPPVPNPRKRSI